MSLQKPQELEFEGTKYTGKLWKYWMSKESDTNFKKDITNREGQVKRYFRFYIDLEEFQYVVIKIHIIGKSCHRNSKTFYCWRRLYHSDNF